MERIAEAVRDTVGPVGLLEWAMWAADGIAATELADQEPDRRAGSAAGSSAS